MFSLFGAWVFGVVMSASVILSVVYLGKIGWLSNILGRKIMHIGTGPAYLLCWCLYPDSVWAPYLASSIILLLLTVFTATGLGLMSADALVAVVSRSGNRAELLVGPLLYGIAIMGATLGFWFRSPNGMVSIMTLCLGDGVADIFGRKYGKGNPLPWNQNKSLAGSIAFWTAAFWGSLGIVQLFLYWGYLAEDFQEGVEIKCAMVVTVAALVESLPIGHIDNILIVMASTAAGKLLW